MTLRSKDSGIIVGFTTEGQFRNWTDPESTTIDYISSAERQYFVGQNIPNFHRRKDAGDLLPHTSFTQSEWRGEGGGGHYSNRGHTTNDTVSLRSNWGGIAMPNVLWRIQDFPDNNVEMSGNADIAQGSYLVQQAAAAIYSNGWDALTFAAEAHKTASMFKNLVSKIRSLTRNFSKKKLLEAWLEGRYGMRTLAYDIRDFNNAIQHFDAERKIWSERQGFNYSEHYPRTLVDTATYGPSTYKLFKTARYNYGVRGSVSALIEPDRFIIDPIKTGYELIPLSFVIDWVYNIGVALDSFAFMASATDVTASIGTSCEYEVTYEMEVESNSDNHNVSGDCSFRYTGTRVTRTPTSIKTRPHLTSRLATPDLLLDLQALAEVRTRFR